MPSRDETDQPSSAQGEVGGNRNRRLLVSKGTQRVGELWEQEEQPSVIWDESVLEKPESLQARISYGFYCKVCERLEKAARFS